MITINVTNPLTSYSLYKQMYELAKGSSKGCLKPDTFNYKLRSEPRIVLPNAIFILADTEARIDKRDRRHHSTETIM